MYHYPPAPGGLATQGDLLCQGLNEIGVEARPVNQESDTEKAWYYRWFRPDVVVGVGYWGDTPDLVLHPHSFKMLAVPWLVADGYVVRYRQTLNSLPLILVTSQWVKDVYVRDGIRAESIEVLPVGVSTDLFVPRSPADPMVMAARAGLRVSPEELMILTVGGDAASKGGREVLQALARIMARHGASHLPPWKYIFKVWPQERTAKQTQLDMQLVRELHLSRHVRFVTDIVSRNYMPFLMSACDIYAAPSRLEGFGMSQIEAGACAKPVVSMAAMGMLDTLVHGETALLARVGVENRVSAATFGVEMGFTPPRQVIFDPPRVADYRANVDDLADDLLALMTDPVLRDRLGMAGRRRVVERFDYRQVAKRFVQIIGERLGVH
jgi:glycosyltransferase involved in cell wall biosynthesis